MTSVRTAVIPAAGLGTRFLPASKAIPKEMVPVVDKPTIQYIVEECVAAGIEDVLIIDSSGKSAIGDHFDRLMGLEAALEAKGKTAELEMVRGLAELCDIHFVRQGVALGLGHAIGIAERHVGDEPFAVLLGDDVQVDGGALLRGMIETHEAQQGSVIALLEVEPDEISSYGCIDPIPIRDNLYGFERIVEKPSAEEAPSNLAVIGRYVFTPDIFDAIRQTEPGVGGEIQITDAIGLLNQTQPVTGFSFKEGRYDCGKPLDYLKATVEIACMRDDLGPAFKDYLKGFVATLD
ncbi:MAG TPA: UTP--glucose-1-phosphate uridylyltransferase [Acidimicrobiaceae bacterium]|nr:UTP--glucose-1-phosphate uridylyltransferase [Acidimicrobiaceae bacterium]